MLPSEHSLASIRHATCLANADPHLPVVVSNNHHRAKPKPPATLEYLGHPGYVYNALIGEDMSGSEDRKEIERRIVTVTCEVLAVSEDAVDVKVDSIKDLAEDSLDQMRLYMALEDEFGGTISEEQLEAITSFKDVVDYIVSMHQGNPAK